MDTTPLWVPLVVAALGVVGSVGGTITGVIITQRRSDRREEAQWNREQAKEREAWARQDALRTFEQRRACYVDFEEHLRSTARAVYNAGYGLGPELDRDWQIPPFQSLLRLQVFSTRQASKAAAAAYDALWHWGAAQYTGDEPAFYDAEGVFDTAQANYLAVIRHDLGVDVSLEPYPSLDFKP